MNTIKSEPMGIRVLDCGIIVHFDRVPPIEMFSALRNYGFRYQSGLWFRPSVTHADTVIASLRRTFDLYSSPKPERKHGTEGTEARGEGGAS